MCALRSSSMIFTENRNNLRPVRVPTKTDIPDVTKRNMLLRAKKLSLDSDSLMKSLQEKYEEKESKPPPVLGLGVRRYKGSKSYLGPGREVDVEVEEKPNVEVKRKKSVINSHPDSHLMKIQEETAEDGSPAAIETPYEQEESLMEEVDRKLREVEDEAKSVMAALEEDDLSLDGDTNGENCEGAEEHSAAASGNIAALKWLLKNGCEVDKKDADGNTAVQLACSNGHTLAVRLLAKHGAALGVLDGAGRSLLHTAVLGGQQAMVAALLDANAPRDVRDARRGRTALHLATLENELVMVKLMLHALAEDPWGSQPLLSLTDKDGRTPLHLAAARGHVDAVRLLLGVGYSVTLRDLYGHTAMHAALGLSHASKRCRVMLRLLLEAGGDLAIQDEHPTDGEDFQSGCPRRGEDLDDITVPLTVRTLDRPAGDAAVELEQESNDLRAELERRRSSSGVIGRRRSSGGWVEEGVDHVERMIHMAARVGCGGCLALLVEYGAPVNSRDRRGRTPLHLAAEAGRADAVRALARLGARLDLVDTRGLTPLHAAISADSGAAVAALLQLGADASIPDGMGRSYAEHALHARKLAAFASLIKCGVSHVAEEGSTILHSCAAHGCITSTQLLLDMGWDPNCTDKGGLTPLHATIGQGHEDIATLLITEGADIRKGDNKGATPLHYAVRWGGSDALLRTLIKRGASHSARDRLGRTALHYAASKFSIMSDLYILLGGGANLNPVDISGLTPLHLAARLGNESLVRILLDRGADPLVKDMYNFTPYDHAKENAHCSIMKRLDDYTKTFCASKKTDSGVMENGDDVSQKTDRSKIDNSDAVKLRDRSSRVDANHIGEPDKEMNKDLNSTQKRDLFRTKTQRGSVAW